PPCFESLAGSYLAAFIIIVGSSQQERKLPDRQVGFGSEPLSVALVGRGSHNKHRCPGRLTERRTRKGHPRSHLRIPRPHQRLLGKAGRIPFHTKASEATTPREAEIYRCDLKSALLWSQTSPHR